MGSNLARKITKWMATWTFIFGILVVCISEITANHFGIVHFDPTMLALNTILSLWAAVQGSIIMINENQASEKRDEMLQAILQIAVAQKKADAKRDKTLKAIVSLEQMIEDHIKSDSLKIDEILKTVKHVSPQ